MLDSATWQPRVESGNRIADLAARLTKLTAANISYSLEQAVSGVTLATNYYKQTIVHQETAYITLVL